MKKATLLFALLTSSLSAFAQRDTIKIAYDKSNAFIYSDCGLTIRISNLTVSNSQKDQLVRFDYDLKTENVDSVFLDIVSEKTEYSPSLTATYQGDIFRLLPSAKGTISFMKSSYEQIVELTINIVSHGRFTPVVIKAKIELDSKGEIKGFNQFLVDRNQFLSIHKCP